MYSIKVSLGALEYTAQNAGHLLAPVKGFGLSTRLFFFNHLYFPNFQVSKKVLFMAPNCHPENQVT